MSKLKKIKVKALPDNLPDYIEVDISKLQMGKSVKVKEIVPQGYEILVNPMIPIASVEIPRALRSKQGAGAE
jgi:large subunit ribosomal protein L25